MATQDLIEKTINPRVGVGSKLFPNTPADINSFAPNDVGFPESPHIEHFIPAHPGDNGLIGGDLDPTRFDEWTAGKPRPDSPDDFAEKTNNQIVDDRREPFPSAPLEPPMDMPSRVA